ncbi:hypothetical protein B9Z55_024341 [Caenorhabditis nigoni]|uniref:Uncharacterized protein n=1 Tax=Caenorhabditis nigoni TaxID=1611254 RepID=A0A2G5STJ9_9PELO|nr:hypothetical protein B9Z55_024341 [Caenorhabditis nigoni]
MGSGASKDSVQLQPKVADIKKPGTNPNNGDSLPATESQKPSNEANKGGISSQIKLSSDMYSQNVYDNYGFCAGDEDHKANAAHAAALRRASPANAPRTPANTPRAN